MPPPPKPSVIAQPRRNPSPSRSARRRSRARRPRRSKLPPEPQRPKHAQRQPRAVAPPEGAAPAAVAEARSRARRGHRPKTLPPRVDLAYKVFYGTQGFLIGDAVYRFEHAEQSLSHRDDRRSARPRRAACCAARARSKAAASSPTRACSRRVLRVERGGPDRVETAVFDWEAGIVDHARQQDRAARPADVRSARAHVAVLFHAADDEQVTFTRRHDAPRVPLHDHARGRRRRSSGRTARSTPSAGIAAATTARPTPTSGSRRRCTTSR